MAIVPFEHADDARAALREIVAEHGPDTLSNPPALSNLLKDLLPDAPGIARLLVAAAEDRIADRFSEHRAHGLDAATAARLTASAFAEATMASPEVCAWIVGEVASALDPQSRLGDEPVPVADAATSPVSAAPDTATVAVGFGPGQAARTPLLDSPPTVVREAADATAADATPAGTTGAGRSGRRKQGLLIGVLATLAVLGAAIGLAVSALWARSPAAPASAAVLEGTWTTRYQVLTSTASDRTYLKASDGPKRGGSPLAACPAPAGRPCTGSSADQATVIVALPSPLA